MILIAKVRYEVKRYFQERLFLVALVAILFITGIVFGFLAAKILDKPAQNDLISFIDQGLHGETVLPNHLYIRQIMVSQIQTVFFLFFMGISVIGIPLALLLIFTRGFVIGFSVGFLLQNMGFKGVVLVITGILPQNLLIIPALFLMLIAIIDCAAALTKIRFTKYPISLGTELIRCSLITLLVLVVMILAGLIQGYLSPLIASWLGSVF